MNKRGTRKRIRTAILALTVALFLTGAGLAADPSGTDQALCPVLGGNINRKVYADYQSKRIYFCCEGCIDTFQKNPETYLKKMQEQGVTPEQAPKGKK